MATGNAGLLVVSLGLNAVEYVSGLSKAEYETRKSMEAIKKSIESVKEVFITLGAGVGIEGFRRIVEGSIESQAELGRLAERAGTTVEELSSMRVAAHEGGVGLDEIALASNRLSKAIFEGQDGTTKAAAAMKLLGLNAAELSKLPTADALKVVAGALAEFNESAGKTAVQMEILGRSGPRFGAFLKTIAENGTVAASVTTDMANAAREAELKIFGLTDQLSILRNQGVNALLPSLNAVVEAFTEITKQSDGQIGFWVALGEALRVVALGAYATYTAFKNVTAALVANARIQADLVQFKFTAAGEEWDKLGLKIEKNTELLLEFHNTIKKGSPLLNALAGNEPLLPRSINDRSAQYKGDPYYGQGGGKKDIGTLASVTRNKDDPTRTILETALAALRANSEQEKAVLANRNEYLKASFERGQISIYDFYAAKQAAQAEDIRITSDNYRQEIALIDTFIRNAATEKEKAQGEKEKVAATSRQQLFLIQAAGRSQQALDEQERQLKLYDRTLQEVNAHMLELMGHSAEAANIRFNVQNEDLRKGLAATIASPSSSAAQVAAARQAVLDLAVTQRAAVAQAALNDVTQTYGFVLQKVGIEQNKIELLLQTGAITEIDAINKRAELAREYIGILQQQLDIQQKIAEDATVAGPQRTQALLNVQKLRLEIEQLAASSDVLAKRFNDIFIGAVSDGIQAVVNRTKSLKDAILDTGKAISTALVKQAADQVSGQLFAKGGPLGGIGGFFADIFGGGKPGTADATKGLASIGLTAADSSKSLLAFTTALDLATAAAESFAGKGALSSIASAVPKGDDLFSSLGGLVENIFSGGPGYASGGSPPVGKISLVGENGPELFIPRTSGNVVPIRGGASGGARVYNLHFYAPEGMSKQTGHQRAVEMARTLAIAERTNR